VGDFIGRSKKEGKHPRAILQALERCYEKKPRPRDPYAYCYSIVRVEDGNKGKEDFMKKEAEREQQLKELEKAIQYRICVNTKNHHFF
jgi:hypothetical protein